MTMQNNIAKQLAHWHERGCIRRTRPPVHPVRLHDARAASPSRSTIQENAALSALPNELLAPLNDLQQLFVTAIALLVQLYRSFLYGASIELPESLFNSTFLINMSAAQHSRSNASFALQSLVWCGAHIPHHRAT